MNNFHIASAVYLAGSILLFGLMYRMGVERRKAFARHFGGLVLEDLDERQSIEWEEYHETRFNAGFWRIVTLVWMVYHYPGFIGCAVFHRGSLHPVLMFAASAIVWIGALFLILRPGS